MEEYRPRFAVHVLGRYERRTLDEDGTPQVQKVTAVCECCKETWQTTCSTGLVRQHIVRFAVQHLHRDPMAPGAA